MTRNRFIAVLAPCCGAAAAALIPATAFAQAEAFGEPGHLVISSDANVSVVGTSTSNNGGSTFTLILQPAVDYFVIRNLSIGGFLLYEHANTSPGGGGPSENSDTFGIGPRIGYNVDITHNISLWPKVFIDFSATNYSQGNASGGENQWTLGIYAPFLYHPAEHFFLGLGPFLSAQLANNVSQGNQSASGPTTTTYGIEFTVGGWFGL